MILLFALSLVVAWYLLCCLSPLWPRARRATDRLSPYTRRLHAWVLSAPATFAYIAIFTALTLVQRTTPPRLIDLLTRMNSTSLSELRHAPVAALADSALWVANRGSGLAWYIAVFGTVVAWAERRYGPPRMIVICVSGHVLGSLLTALVELDAIQSGHASHKLAHTTDVGVSYMLVAGSVAAVLLMRGWWRAAGVAALTVFVVWPVISDHTIWDLGHLLAMLSGLAVAAVTLLLSRPRPSPASEAGSSERLMARVRPS
jgi:hypothetical protein